MGSAEERDLWPWRKEVREEHIEECTRTFLQRHQLRK